VPENDRLSAGAKPRTAAVAVEQAYSWLAHIKPDVRHGDRFTSGFDEGGMANALIAHALRTGATVYTKELSGDRWPDPIDNLPSDTKKARLAKSLEGKALLASIMQRFGFRSLYETRPDEHSNRWTQTWVGGKGGFTVSGGCQGAQGFMVVNDAETCDKLSEALYKALLFRPPPKREERHERGMVSMLTSHPQYGISLRTVGVAGVDFERGNYDDDVLAGYDHVCEDLATSSPCGRLALFDGPPGTGKTYLIRAMLKKVKTAGFVIVPPSMVEALGNPDVVPAVADGAYGMPNNRMVFLIEDADEALVPRDRAVAQQRSNVKALSSLLNMSDGIMGSMFDVRVVCSTNALLTDIDPAVVRDGRLCRRLAVGALTVQRANQVFRRLLPSFPTAGAAVAEPFTEPATLATVYRKAREAGWAPAISLLGSILPAKTEGQDGGSGRQPRDV
jgi:hypothetical protein